MSVRFDLATIDAADSKLLVSFWSNALELVVTEDEDDGRWTVLGDATAPRQLGIQRISDLAAAVPSWTGAAKPRVHLDLACSPAEVIEQVERLISLGATRLRDDRNEAYGFIATLADPEGNVFDLCAYKSSGSSDEGLDG